MSGKTKRKSDTEKKMQKIRTTNNKKKKYERLLEAFPNSPHKTAWEKKLA